MKPKAMENTALSKMDAISIFNSLARAFPGTAINKKHPLKLMKNSRIVAGARGSVCING
jgi:hypothetical protein